MWMTTTRNKHFCHTNWWANKLQVPLPGRMNLAADKIVNQGALEDEEIAELCKTMKGV